MTAASIWAWWDALLSGSQGATLLTIVLMAVITVVSRSFFFISDAEWTLPRWSQRGLQYAPMAALSAVVIPELVMTQGVFIHTVLDARLYGAVAGADAGVFGNGALGVLRHVEVGADKHALGGNFALGAQVRKANDVHGDENE